MKKALLALTLATLPFAVPTARAQEPTPISYRFTELLRAFSNGHAPTSDQIIAAAAQVQPTRDDLHQAVPLILKALDSPDKDVRAYTLTTLSGLQTTPPTPEALGAAAAKQSASTVALPVLPSTYSADIARELTPIIPQIATHLTDESEPNRLLAAAVLGGFTPNPPASVYVPLLAYLKRDDAINPVGQAVVEDLLGLGPVSDEVAAAITRYLRRSDQTADTRSNLIESIATRPYQSAAVNRTLLLYLDAEDSRVRSRLILSLPQLDLSPEVFADTRSRVAALASNDQENLQVVNAAKAVATCWTGPHMTSPCPAY